MPVSLEQFVKHLVDSRLMSNDDVSSFCRALPEQPQTCEDLAEALVREKKLTRFQVDRVIAGKCDGLVIREYVVRDKIGEGGMGEVYMARHRRMKRYVAIKAISPKTVDSTESVQRFHREVEASAQLDHPNIVPAYDAFEVDGRHYLVMKYVKGRDLSAVVKSAGMLTVEQACDYVIQAARGLAYAHGEGVIHRDIKPGNLVLDEKGRIKVLDMGLARIEQEPDELGATAMELTGTGQVMGTVDYMAPEQSLDTRSADARSDVYSLGCTLFFLLTANRMFDGDTAIKRLIAHRESEIPDLKAIRGSVPDDVVKVFRKMVAKKPEDRFQSMADVVAALISIGATVKYSQPAETAKNAKPELNVFLDQISTENYVHEHRAKKESESVMPADVETVNVKKKPARHSRNISNGPVSNGKRRLLLGGGFLAFILLAGIITIATKKGTVTVNISDRMKAGVEVKIKTVNGDKEIAVLDKANNWTVKLAGGEYIIDLAGGNDEFSLKDDTLIVSRFGKNFVKIDYSPNVEVAENKKRTPQSEVRADLPVDAPAPAIAHPWANYRVEQFLKELPEVNQWERPQVISVKSQQGVTFEELSDGSFLVVGKVEHSDVYTIELSPASRLVSAIRLEALADKSLPSNGPGLHSTGNFHLSSFKGTVNSSQSSNHFKRIQFTKAFCNFQYNHQTSPLASIDDKSKDFWHVFGRTGEQHTAVFVLSSLLSIEKGERLKIELSPHEGDDSFNFGRFRLSIATQHFNERNELLRMGIQEKGFKKSRNTAAALLILDRPEQALALASTSKKIEQPSVDSLLLQTLAFQQMDQPDKARSRYFTLKKTMRKKLTKNAPLNYLFKELVSEIEEFDEKQTRTAFKKWSIEGEVESLKAIIEQPKQSDIHKFRHLSKQAQRIGDWKTAGKARIKVIELDIKGFIDWVPAAAYALISKDDDAHQRVVQSLLNQPGLVDFLNGTTSTPIVVIALVTPRFASLDKLPISQLKTQLKHDPFNHWSRLALIMYQYRSKDYKQVLVSMEELSYNRKDIPVAIANLFKAMSLFQLGRAAEAEKTYNSVSDAFPKELTPTEMALDSPLILFEDGGWVTDSILGEIVRREAEALIFGKPKNDAKPKTE